MSPVAAPPVVLAGSMTLRPVRRGGQYVRQAQGGVIRDRAPSDGFAYEVGEEVGFIAEKDVQAALVDLKLAQRNGRRP